MESFENFLYKPPQEKIEKDVLKQEKEGLQERQERIMISEEKDRLTKKFEKVTGKAKALLAVFLLSTAIGYESAQAFEKKQVSESIEKDYITMKTGGEIIIESTDSFDVLHRDKQFTWGVEYVLRKEFIAQRYVKIDNSTGEVTILGEFDNVFQAAEGIAKISDIPEKIKQRAERDAKAIQIERDFQASGLTKPTRKIEGKTHIEERNFEGYGVRVKTVVEVDEAGNVVKLLKVSEIEGQGFKASESGDVEESSENLSNELSPYEKSVLEEVRKREADLLEKGWLELPNGKHGIEVPGSEKIVDGKKIHTEVRRVYDDNGFDVITIWEVDDKGNEISYRTTNRGEKEYNEYLKIIEPEKK